MEDYGITAEQYHARLDKLWKALENVKYNGEDDVFTMCEKRIKNLEAGLEMIIESSESYTKEGLVWIAEQVLDDKK